MVYCQLVAKKNQKDRKVADGVDPPQSPRIKIGQGRAQVEWNEHQSQQRKASILTCKKHDEYQDKVTPAYLRCYFTV